MRFATPDPVLTALRAGGESLHTVMGPVLEAAIEVLEQHSISSPRKAWRPLRDIIDRAEVIVDEMDRVWCDTVSRSAELEHLAQLIDEDCAGLRQCSHSTIRHGIGCVRIA